MVATLTATVLSDTAGVKLDIAFPATVTKVSVGRYDPSGFVQLIRNGSQVTLAGGLATIYDYEAPLDVNVRYIATQMVPPGPPTEVAESAVKVIPSQGLSWLKDPALPSKNMPLRIITSIAQLSRPSRAGVFNILDRTYPVVVTNKRQAPIGEMVCHTLSDQERTGMTDLLARGSILLLQTPGAYGWGSQYVYVSDAVESRVGLAMEQARRWTLPFVVVDRPEGLTEGAANPKTWQAVKDIYATWDALAATGKTWDQLLEEGP